MRKVLKETSPNILHINNGGYPAASSAQAAVIAAKSIGIKNIVYMVNNVAMDYSHPVRWYDYPIDFFVKRFVSKFITGSEHAGLALKKVLSLPNERWHKIYNGVFKRDIKESIEETRARLNIPSNKLVFGNVALFEERKGHKVLIDSIKKVKDSLGEECPVFLLEGHGPLLEKVKEQVIELQLTQDVFFVGDEENIFDFINALDVFVLPSIRNEDFPNVILEAMCLGKAVIGTNIAGVPEQIVEGETGLVVQENSVNALSVAIEKLARDYTVVKSMGINGKQRFDSHFTVEHSLDKYRSLYKELLKD